jgi:hypothetical protein
MSLGVVRQTPAGREIQQACCHPRLFITPTMVRFRPLLRMLVRLFRGRQSLLLENLAASTTVALSVDILASLDPSDKLFWAIARRVWSASNSSSSRPKPSSAGIGWFFYVLALISRVRGRLEVRRRRRFGIDLPHGR